MVWNAQNSFFAGGFNTGGYTAPNHAAYFAPNHPPYSSPNHSPYTSPNHSPYSAPNHPPYSSPNHAAYSSPNHAANSVFPATLAVPVISTGTTGTTGAGGASGSGFAGGYGPVARFEYATHAGVAPLPWVLDFAISEDWPSFPFELRIDPNDPKTPLTWQVSDWDPALRFWTLKFDPLLTEWLQDLNLANPAVMVAREFASASDSWLAKHKDKDSSQSALQLEFERDGSLLEWHVAGKVKKKDAWIAINRELNDLIDLMRDDRMRYLAELGVQSSQIIPFFVHLMRFDPAQKPWTMELMNCASSIGNLVKMQYKSHYLRVRPSTLCPGLVPPWGPAQHPSFPSGHSTVVHLTALLLLSVPGIAQRFGIYADQAHHGRQPTLTDFDSTSTTAKAYGKDQRSPLLWLAWRIAKGRERMGVHYKSDSAAGRWLAALVWDSCLHPSKGVSINVPTLHNVLRKAQAEWPVFG
jgi:hypothetical protein